MLRKVLHIVFGLPLAPSTQQTNPAHMSAHRKLNKERELIHLESKIGASLFGQIPKGHTREFFSLDEHTWVWFEQWYNEKLKTTEQMNIHFEFQPRGVLKVVNGEPRGYVEGQELTHLLQVIKTYHERVASEVYGYTLAHA